MDRPETPESPVGQYIGGYRVERKIGQGGMGTVYELLHHGIGRRMALKLLSRGAGGAQAIDRFFDEARAVNLIGHPNIVDITDYSQLPSGSYYILMEYLEGRSLAAYLADARALEPAEVARIVLPICSALDAAHAKGIVHRDVKPENIFLVARPDDPQYVKVLDFGIAKLSTDIRTAAPLTGEGTVLGTPTYMAPEQASASSVIDARTDVYAVGVLLFHMLTGQPPFVSDRPVAILHSHMQSPPPSLLELRPGLSPAWEVVVHIAMAKSPANRFQSMAELSEAVRGALEGREPERELVAPSGPEPGAATLVDPPLAPASPHSSPADPSAVRAPVTNRWWFVPLALTTMIAVTVAVSAAIIASAPEATRVANTDAAMSFDAAMATASAAPPDAGSAPVEAAADAAPQPPGAAQAPPDAAPRPRSAVGKGKVFISAKPWATIYINRNKYGSTP